MVVSQVFCGSNHSLGTLNQQLCRVAMGEDVNRQGVENYLDVVQNVEEAKVCGQAREEFEGQKTIHLHR